MHEVCVYLAEEVAQAFGEKITAVIELFSPQDISDHHGIYSDGLSFRTLWPKSE